MFLPNIQLEKITY